MNFLKTVAISYRNGINMPAAPRPKGKATKIAIALLGIPENRLDKKSKADKRIDARLLYEDTRLVK